MSKSISERYLQSLDSPKSRVSVASCLNIVASYLSGDEQDRDSFAWDELRYDHVNEVKDYLRTNDKAPNTINTYLAAIKGISKEAWKLKLMSVDDYMRIKDVKRTKGSREPTGRALSLKELNALLDHCMAQEGARAMRDACIIGLSYGAGLRREEAVSLDLQNYNTKTKILKVRGKGNKERAFPVNQRIVDILDCWLDERGREPGPLFVRYYKGGSTKLERLSDQTIYDVIVRRYKEAGLQSMTPHDFRRTFATNLFKEGVAGHVVQRMMGHKSLETTLIYNKGDKEEEMLVASKALPL